MTTITFGRHMCGYLPESSTRERLVTAGIGGYAMGIVAGLRTRRYADVRHGAAGCPFQPRAVAEHLLARRQLQA